MQTIGLANHRVRDTRCRGLEGQMVGSKTHKLGKGFLQSKVLGEVFVLEVGPVRGEVFGEVWGEVFGKVFGLVLLGHSEQKRTSAQIRMALQSKTGKHSGEELHDEVLQGDPGLSWR